MKYVFTTSSDGAYRMADSTTLARVAKEAVEHYGNNPGAVSIGTFDDETERFTLKGMFLGGELLTAEEVSLL